MVPMVYDWSGVYVGFNGGWGTASRCFDQTGLLWSLPRVATARQAVSPAGRLGYRWQMSSWVFGFEAQGDWASLKGSNVSLRHGQHQPLAN